MSETKKSYAFFTRSFHHLSSLEMQWRYWLLLWWLLLLMVMMVAMMMLMRWHWTISKRCELESQFRFNALVLESVCIHLKIRAMIWQTTIYTVNSNRACNLYIFFWFVCAKLNNKYLFWKLKGINRRREETWCDSIKSKRIKNSSECNSLIFCMRNRWDNSKRSAVMGKEHFFLNVDTQINEQTWN